MTSPAMAGTVSTKSIQVFTGESPRKQILVICLCLAYFFILVLQQGLRYGQMRGKQIKSKFLEVLLHIQFFTTIAIFSSVVLLEAGLRMATDSQCYAASVVCILLFGISKTALFVIFNERVHALRAPSIKRVRDIVWVTCTICFIAGVAASIYFAAAAPLAQLERKTGQCSIRLTQEAVVGFSTFLLAVGSYLTCMFICMLWPTRKSREASALARSSMRTEQRMEFVSASRNGTLQEDELGRKRNTTMICKNVIGWTAMLSFTLINMIVYLTKTDAKRSHICLLSCLSDLSSSMFITSWLMKNATENVARPELGEEMSCPRSRNENALQIAEAKSVASNQSMTIDSWTKYMETLRDGEPTNFNMKPIDARMGPALPGSVSCLIY